MRPDLCALEPGEAALAELNLLLARRRDLVTDQSRTIIRLKEALLSLFPALERALDLNRRGALRLVAHYQTPARIRRTGRKRLATYPRETAVSKEPMAAVRPSPQPEPRALPCLPKR
jgi:hypothetical protein